MLGREGEDIADTFDALCPEQLRFEVYFRISAMSDEVVELFNTVGG